MTDNEIIKALECCGVYDCEFCPCYTEDLGCDYNLELLALDLIRRQNIKLEKLQKENRQFADIGKMYSEIKSEARKEFAKRLKDEIENLEYNAVFKAVSATATFYKFNDTDRGPAYNTESIGYAV